MQTSPNRIAMSPAQVARDAGLWRVRTLCPCCGGSKGIRAALRFRPFLEYLIDVGRAQGRKAFTLRTHRTGR